MTTQSELHVVLGARGGVGQVVARMLAEQGKRVRAVNRSGKADAPAGVELVAADLMQRDATLAACQGASVVYHCAGVPYNEWASAFPIMMENSIAASSAAGAKLVFADNCYMYAPTAHPMTEDLPYNPVTRKGAVRKQLAETLMAAHAQGKVRAVIGRATDFYGPGVVNSTMGERFFKALVAGKRVEWLGKLDQPHAMTFVDDFARRLIVLGAQDDALGQVWHIPVAEPLTGLQYITLASEVAGIPARPTTLSAGMLRLVGVFNPIVRELGEMMYEFNGPYLIDGSKYMHKFGGTPTPHREAMQYTVAWYQERAGAFAHA